MYSLMSTRISADASANRNFASERASSVFPTPVGPLKMNEPIGRFGILEPSAAAPDRPADRLDGLVLPDHVLVQLVLHPQQAAGLRLLQPRHGNSRPPADDERDLLLAEDRAVRLAPLLPLLLLLPDLALDLPLLVTERGGLLEVLVAHGGFLVAVHLLQLRLERGHLRRRRLRGEPRPRTRFVDHVDRLVGQEPVGDVALRLLRRDEQRRVGDRHLVMILVLLSQPLENLHRLVDRGRIDDDRLEAALERAVLLDVLAVLVERRRTDALQLTARERGLQHVARVDRAFGRARADERVQLVDEQDDVLVLGDLVHDRLEPLLELAAVLRAGDDRRHVERQDAVVAQRLRALAVRDELRQPFDDRRLADAGLADEHRVVLLAAREHLHHALDLLGATDRRVELPLGGELRQVAAEVVERRSLGLLLALGRGAAAAARRPTPARHPAAAASPCRGCAASPRAPPRG